MHIEIAHKLRKHTSADRRKRRSEGVIGSSRCWSWPGDMAQHRNPQLEQTKRLNTQLESNLQGEDSSA